MRATVHQSKDRTPAYEPVQVPDAGSTSMDRQGPAQPGFQPAPGLFSDLPPLRQPRGDGRSSPGSVAPQLRRSYRSADGGAASQGDPIGSPINGGPIRRETFSALENYQRAASGSDKASEKPAREPIEGITPGSVGQLSGKFSDNSPQPDSPARAEIEGAAGGSVGQAAHRINDREMADLIHRAKDDWPTVKEMYGSDVAKMTALVNYRKRFVDGLLEALRADKRFASMATRAAGSTALTSDYDITFLGIEGAEAVQEFNKRFGKHWGKEAGTVFDTNVYAEDVLPPKAQVLAGTDDISLLGSTANFGNVDARLDEGLQDVSSLVKVRKNMTHIAWFRFVDTILQALRPNRGATAEAASRFADANTIFERTLVPQILKEVESAEDGRGKKELAKLRKKGITSNVALVEAIMKVDEGIAGSNRVYEAKLLYAADLEVRRNTVDRAENPRQWDSLTADLRRAKADAMLFANEPYFSAGTLYHVVGNVQAKFGATLSSAAYFQSLQENYGDTLKELNHLHGKEWSVVAIKASKYVWRTLDAAFQMKAAGVEVSCGLDLSAFRDAMKKALDVRQGVAGTTTDQALAALKSAGLASEEQLKAALTKLLVAANTAVRGGKAPADSLNQGSRSESDET
jgi:hypothetical protein